MPAVVVDVALLFVFAAGGWALVHLAIRARRRAAGGPGDTISVPVVESITAFGEELQALSFSPSGKLATVETVNEYRQALDAYDRAEAATSEAAAVAALQGGRAALIRLDARLNGRPIPIEAVRARTGLDARGHEIGAPVAEASGERFLSIGRGQGKTEVLIDRPEGGRPAIVEVTATGDGHLLVDPTIRTRDHIGRPNGLDLDWLDPFVNGSGSYHGRHYLPPEATHLRIEASHGDQRWEIRARSLGTALPLEDGLRGEGDEVLAYDGDGDPISVQVRSQGNWSVRFRCACGKGDGCRCGPHDARRVHGLGDGQQELYAPRSGWIIVRMLHGGRWSLQTVPSRRT